MLALVRAFKLSQSTSNSTVFFKTDRVRDGEGRPEGYIVPLEDIVQPAPLTPRFAMEADQLHVTNDSCIDECDQFWVNSFHSKHTYQTIW